jgi:hypothetical protein
VGQSVWLGVAVVERATHIPAALRGDAGWMRSYELWERACALASQAEVSAWSCLPSLMQWPLCPQCVAPPIECWVECWTPTYGDCGSCCPCSNPVVRASCVVPTLAAREPRVCPWMGIAPRRWPLLWRPPGRTRALVGMAQGPWTRALCPRLLACVTAHRVRRASVSRRKATPHPKWPMPMPVAVGCAGPTLVVLPPPWSPIPTITRGRPR